jgi:hypothetical protein
VIGTKKSQTNSAGLAGPAGARLIAFDDGARNNVEKRRVSKALTTLKRYSFKNPEGSERLERLLLELGDGTPRGDAVAICSGLKIFSSTRRKGSGIERLEQLKKTNLRGYDLEILIRYVYGGKPDVAFAAVYVNAAEFDMNLLRGKGEKLMERLRRRIG